MNSSTTSPGQSSGSRVQIQGLTRHARHARQVPAADLKALPAENVNEVASKRRRVFPFTILELAVLAAGFGAFAALMTSCSSTRSQGSGEVVADSEPISTGLSSLLSAKSKNPKLNTPVEISKDSDFQQLANQAKLDYEALFNRDPKATRIAKNDAAPSNGLNELKGTATPAVDLSDVQEQPIVLEPTRAEVRHEVVQPLATPVESPRIQENAGSAESSKPVVAVPVPEIGPAVPAPVAEAPKVAVAGNSPVLAAGNAQPEVPVFKGSNALLASRVTGYGRYVPLPSRPGHGTFVFQSARSNRAIVYIEIENFGYRAAKEADPDKMPGDQWAVDLSTEMQLLDAYDGMLQVKEPERSVIETGRNKRKDFYLVQEIELPPTLTIGSYNLKIVLRDKSGAEAVRTEAIIPIQIVADLTAIVDER